MNIAGQVSGLLWLLYAKEELGKVPSLELNVWTSFLLQNFFLYFSPAAQGVEWL